MKDNIWIGDFETEAFRFDNKKDYIIESRFCCFINIFTKERKFFNIEKDGEKPIVDFIKSIGTKRNSARIYFHNLNFDLAFLFSLLPKDVNYRIIKSGSRILQFLTYRTVIRKGGRKTKYTILDLRNSLALFPTSLRTLGKELGFPKMEADYNMKEITEQYIEYCYRDCEVIEKALYELLNKKKELYGYETTIEKLPLTVSALNKKIFHWLGVQKYDMNFYEMIYDKYQKSYVNKMRPFYFGGRVEVLDFNTCFFGNYNDFNSLYPAQMKDKEFPLAPYKSIFCTEQEKCWSSWSDNPLMFGAICKIIENSYLPLIPTRLESGKILFGNGEKTCFLFREEIDYLHELNVKIELIECWSCSGYAKVFDDYMTPAYQLKRTSKGFAKFDAKLSMNGLYGKFAEKPDKEVIEFINTPLNELTDLELMDVIPVECKDGSIINIKRTIETSDKLKINIFFAMLITARARLELHKAMSLSKRCYYGDTDSLVNNEIYEYDDSLGGLKAEFSFEKFQALGCKEYIYECYEVEKQVCLTIPLFKSVFKMKGFGKLQSYKNVSDFKDKFFEPKKQHRQVGFMESFNRKKSLNEMLVFNKYKQSVYDKRWIMDDFTTKPFNMDVDDFDELLKNNYKMIMKIVNKVI